MSAAIGPWVLSRSPWLRPIQQGSLQALRHRSSVQRPRLRVLFSWVLCSLLSFEFVTGSDPNDGVLAIVRETERAADTDMHFVLEICAQVHTGVLLG